MAIYLEGADCISEDGVSQAKLSKQFLRGPGFLTASEELVD